MTLKTLNIYIKNHETDNEEENALREAHLRAEREREEEDARRRDEEENANRQKDENNKNDDRPRFPWEM